MTFPKVLPWFARLLFSLVLAAGATLLRAAPEPPDPLTGNWLYYKDIAVTFNADGTADWKGKSRFHGTWQYLQNPQVQRHYRIIWEQGKSIDDLILAEDGQHAHVRNATGEHAQYDVRRAIPDKPVARAGATPAVPGLADAADAADPVLGDWLWAANRPVTFKPDGTVVSQQGPQGIWEYLHNPEAERKYRVTWGGGRSVDTLSYARDAAAGRVINAKGKGYDVHRGSSASPAPSGQDPNPFGTR